MAAPEDPIAAFQAAMAQRGLVLKGVPIGDGRLHRFDVEGDRKGSKNGYYALHLDGRPAGAFGCWKRGVKETWKANGAKLSDFDHAKLMREIEAERKRREQKRPRAEGSGRGRRRAVERLRAGASRPPLPGRKQMQPNGARIDGQGRLVLAMRRRRRRDSGRCRRSTPTAASYSCGGRKQGCMFLIGEPADRIVVAEGFATGACIHEATGLCVAVAFDAGNLEPVAKAIRERNGRDRRS